MTSFPSPCELIFVNFAGAFRTHKYIKRCYVTLFGSFFIIFALYFRSRANKQELKRYVFRVFWPY